MKASAERRGTWSAASIAMVVTGTVAMLWAVAPLVEFGTCASGGPYEIAQECPAAYDYLFWIILGGVLLAVAGLVLGGVTLGAGYVFLLMGTWFVALGVAALISASSMEGDSRLGLNIVGWLFLPMGLGAVILGFFIARSERRGRKNAPTRPA